MCPIAYRTRDTAPQGTYMRDKRRHAIDRHRAHAHDAAAHNMADARRHDESRAGRTRDLSLDEPSNCTPAKGRARERCTGMASKHCSATWFEPRCYVLLARDQLEEAVGGVRKHEPRAEPRHTLSSWLGGSWSCSLRQNEEIGKMTRTKMAFLSRDSGSVSGRKRLALRCWSVLERSRAKLRNAQRHCACSCNCDADDGGRAGQHVPGNTKNNPEREDGGGRGRAMLLSIFRGQRGRTSASKGALMTGKRGGAEGEVPTSYYRRSEVTVIRFSTREA